MVCGLFSVRSFVLVWFWFVLVGCGLFGGVWLGLMHGCRLIWFTI